MAMFFKRLTKAAPIAFNHAFRDQPKSTFPSFRVPFGAITAISGGISYYYYFSSPNLAPPASLLPPSSTSLDKSSETQLTSSSNDPVSKVQSLEMEIEDDSFMGMPFVLLSDGNWIKNNGSDFYVEFGGGAKQVQKVVKGLGEALVGAYPGHALSFTCKKNDLNSPQMTSLRGLAEIFWCMEKKLYFCIEVI